MILEFLTDTLFLFALLIGSIVAISFVYIKKKNAR
ncbi:EYxxD motif small membrane protein [Bacillus solimangrovi]